MAEPAITATRHAWITVANKDGNRRATLTNNEQLFCGRFVDGVVGVEGISKLAVRGWRKL